MHNKKLAFLDLDGVIADPQLRFAHAQAFVTALRAAGQRQLAEKDVTGVYWREVFNPKIIDLDTPIPGAAGQVDGLKATGWQIIYHTSRPELLRRATMAWLARYAMPEGLLAMKPPSAQFQKTALWKAITVQTLAGLLRAEEVLVVDDEDANLALLRAYEGPKFRLCQSLQDALHPTEAKTPLETHTEANHE
jgi:hypothetical protein